MLTNRRLLTNAAVNTLGFIAQIAVSFVMAPITIAALGDVRYGLWSFVESFLAYMLLFDLGVAASLVRFVPRFVTAGDRASLNRTYSACLIFFLGAAAIAALVGWFGLSFAADRWIAIPPELAPEMRLVALVVVAHFALSLPLSVYPAMLDGLHAFVAKSVTRTIFLLMRIPALMLVFRTAAPLLNMVLVLAVANVLESLILAWLVHRWLPQLRFAPRHVDRETIRAVRGYSVDAFIAMLAGRLAFSTDAFIIGRLLNVPAIGHFSIANRVVDLAKTILRSATTTLTPAVSASEARGDLDAVRAFVIHGTRLSLYFVLPIQIGLFVFGRPFLVLWIGPEYAAAATPSLWILNVTLALTIAQSVASRVLYGMGRIRTFARVTLLEGIVNVALSVILIRPLGIAGSAWGTTIPHIACCIFVIGMVGRLLGLSTGNYIRAAWLMPLAAAIIPLCLWWPLSDRVTTWTWPTLVGCGCIGLAPYAVLVAAIERFGWRPAVQKGDNIDQRRAA
jgi:O-antigen/teichoic acid export membrane protein